MRQSITAAIQSPGTELEKCLVNSFNMNLEKPRVWKMFHSSVSQVVLGLSGILYTRVRLVFQQVPGFLVVRLQRTPDDPSNDIT